MSGSSKSGSAAKPQTQGNYISLMALVMMNVTIVAGLANDVQQAFYGLSSVTLFIIGAIVFFLPTGLVAAELASGWGQRGGIFRWVGEAMGPGLGFSCLMILWLQTAINFGSGVGSASTTIGFFTPDWTWAVDYMNHPKNELLVMICWLAFYWFLTWVSTKGVKAFAKLTKYGVLIGTFIPLAFVIIFTLVWLAQGHTSNVEFSAENLLPKWQGLSTLSLAAGVFFSFAGIDMNAAHIKQLRHPQKEFPKSIFIAMVLALIIFIAGTICIAIITPEKEMNLVYGLNQAYKILGETFGAPWIYVIFVWAGLGTTIANLVTNMAGPSFMLGQAGRSGFLPKILQNNNKHGMPSRLMYLQMTIMTGIAFIIFLIPNVEGFVILMTQAVTILYMIYYVLMFLAFLKLRKDQPNRPRLFKVPGGKFGAYLTAGAGLAACFFGIVLAIIPPAQVKQEVGSPVTYVVVILAIIIGTMALCFFMFRSSRRHNWVDPKNQFAPFTWQIEGLKKPEKVTSNVPTSVLSEDQNPMGMPIKTPWKPDAHVELSDAHKGKGGHTPTSPALEAGTDIAAVKNPIRMNGISHNAPGATIFPQPVADTGRAAARRSARKK